MAQTSVGRSDALDAIDELLRGAGHELKTPLTALKLGLDGVNKQLAAERLDRDALSLRVAACQRQVDRLAGIVANLLDFSRAQTGRLSIRREPVDLAQVVRDAAGRLSEDARRAGCSLAVIADEPVMGRWDRERLSRVTTGLLLNALKFGAGLPVEVGTSVSGQTARLWVRDHGAGLSPEAARRVFDREGTPASGHASGLRLTLFVARHVIEAMGGQMSVESAEGAGATFWVTLPVSR